MQAVYQTTYLVSTNLHLSADHPGRPVAKLMQPAIHRIAFCLASILLRGGQHVIWCVPLQVSMPASAAVASGISSTPDGRASSPVARTHNEPEPEPLIPALVEDPSSGTIAAAPGPHAAAPEEAAPTVLQVRALPVPVPVGRYH